MASMNTKIKRLKKKMNDKAEESSPYNEIEEQEIKKLIKSEAGRDPRTVKKYFNELEEMGLIQETIHERYRLNYDLQPDTEKVEAGERKSVRVRADKNLVETAESLGIDKNFLFEKALLDELGSYKQFIGTGLTDKEAELVYDFLVNKCFKKTSRKALRKKLYSEKFNGFDREHCDRLRLKSFRLAEDLGLVSKDFL